MADSRSGTGNVQHELEQFVSESKESIKDHLCPVKGLRPSWRPPSVQIWDNWALKTVTVMDWHTSNILQCVEFSGPHWKMPGNQLILKTGLGRERNRHFILSFFLVTLGWLLMRRRSFFIEEFYLINREGIIEMEHHHYASPCEIMSLDNVVIKWLLKH